MDYPLQVIETTKDPEILKQPSKPVEWPLDDAIKDLIAALKAQVVKLNGVGLAAPQLGQPWQIMVIHISEQAAELRREAATWPVTAYINPHYEPLDGAKLEADWEGCFSVSETTGKVPRYDKVRISALDETGQPLDFEAQGFLARVFQHEIDHLQGLLILDRLDENTIYGSPQEMAKLRILDMNVAQKAAMKKIIEQAIEQGNDPARYGNLLELIDNSD